jgi:PAS domain S-box-containing protein
MAPRESSSPEAIPAILRYGIAVLSVAIATGAALVLTRFSATLTPFLFAVGATVWYAGVGPGILAIVLSVLSLDLFFVTPFYSFSFRHADLVYLAICTVFALVVGWIAAARRRAEEELRDARDALDAKVLERTTDLRESEGKLEEAQRIARVGYWERDVRTGLVNWSEQSNRIFGLAPNEGPVPIARYQELVHSEDRPRIMAAVAEALAGGKRYDVEYRIVRPSGEVRIIHSQGDVTKDESDRPRRIFGTVQDITERKQAERALQESAQRYRYIFESTGVSIWEEDFSGIHSAIEELKAKGVRDFPRYFAAHPEFVQQAISMVKIVDVNDVTVKLFAAKSKDELLESLHNVFVPETREIFVGQLIAIAEGRTSFGAEVDLQTLKGDRRTALITMTLPPPPTRFDSVLVTLTDITERKRAEYLTGHVFESSPDGMSIVGRDYRFQRVNPVYERFWGMPAGKMLGMRVAEILGTEVFEQRGKPDLDRCFAGEEITHAEWVPTPGGPKYTAISLSPLRPDGQRVDAALVIARDLTDHMRASEALREAQTELAHVNRVTTMGQLTASIAHEVSQPIAATVANAHAALRWLDAQPPDQEEVRLALDDIIKDGKRAGDVIGHIRAIVRNVPPRHDRLDINEAILDVIELTRSELVRKGISLQTEFARGLPSIRGDRIQLQQVILNLIMNAAEAISDASEHSCDLLIGTAADKPGGVRVEVRDSGPGLSQDSLGRLFDPFYTTKRGGMGMGLSICRSIIEAHGGQVGATANVPRGAVFHFTLPVG